VPRVERVRRINDVCRLLQTFRYRRHDRAEREASAQASTRRRVHAVRAALTDAAGLRKTARSPNSKRGERSAGSRRNDRPCPAGPCPAGVTADRGGNDRPASLSPWSAPRAHGKSQKAGVELSALAVHTPVLDRRRGAVSFLRSHRCDADCPRGSSSRREHGRVPWAPWGRPGGCPSA